MKRKLVIGAFAAIGLLLPPFIIHSFPTSYRVHQVYKLNGARLSLSSAPQALEEAIRGNLVRNTPHEVGEEQLHCTPLKDGLEIECVIQTATQEQAEDISTYLEKVFPENFGWISPAELEQRIQSANQLITHSELQLQQFRSNLDTISQELEETTKTFNTAVGRLQEAERELANRTQQLNLIEEALADETPRANREVFEKKKIAIQVASQELKEEITQLSEKISTLSNPMVEKKALEQRMTNLQEQINQTHENIERWSSALPIIPTSSLLPDPDHFRLQPRAEMRPISAQRTWKHLAWSLPLGLGLAALLLGGFWLKTRQPRTFLTADEIEKKLGIPLFAKIPLKG